MGDSLCSCDANGEIEPKSGTAEQENGRFFVQLEKTAEEKQIEENFDDEQ